MHFITELAYKIYKSLLFVLKVQSGKQELVELKNTISESEEFIEALRPTAVSNSNNSSIHNSNNSSIQTVYRYRTHTHTHTHT